jgi:ankyrin repeat protein
MADPEQVEVNIVNSKGMTRLHIAAREGRTAEVKDLLVAGADVNKKNDIGQTALHLAAKNGRTAVVKLLLGKEGVKVDLKDKYELTPFQVATNNEIKYLLWQKMGAPTTLSPTNRQALLAQAINNKKINYVKSLIAAGAKVNSDPTNIENGNLKTLLERTIVQQKNSNKPDLGYISNNNETLKKYLRTEEGRRALRGSYTLYSTSSNNNSIEKVLNLLKRSGKLTNTTLNKLLIEYKGKLNLYKPGTTEYEELKMAIENTKAAMNAKAAANKAAREKANENKAVKEAMERANALRRNEEEKKANRVAKVARNFKTVLQTKVAERKEANAKAAANKAAAEKAAANKEAANKAAANKEVAEKVNSIKGGNFNKLKNISLTNLSDEELKGILQTLSVKGTTDEHKETMKKLLKIWIEKGKTLNSAEISKNSPFIKSLNADIKRITNNYALRQKFKNTSSNLGRTYNTPNTIKRALLTKNGREGIIKSYGLGIPAISPIPEIVSALHKRGSFKNSITLNSLKKDYQNLREAFAGGNQNTQNQLNAAIASISLITNANMRAKINQIKQNIPNELLSGNTKIGLVLKSNGSPYKLVNYTKINQAIKNFKATGKPQNLNNNDIITNAANGTWSLVEVSKNLIKQ